MSNPGSGFLLEMKDLYCSVKSIKNVFWNLSDKNTHFFSKNTPHWFIIIFFCVCFLRPASQDLVLQTARQLDGQTARRPEGQTVRQPESQTARRPDDHTARRPDSQTARLHLHPVYTPPVTGV